MGQQLARPFPEVPQQEREKRVNTRMIIGDILEVWFQFNTEVQDHENNLGIRANIQDDLGREREFYIDERAIAILESEDLQYWHTPMKSDMAKDKDGVWRSKEYIHISDALTQIQASTIVDNTGII